MEIPHIVLADNGSCRQKYVIVAQFDTTKESVHQVTEQLSTVFAAPAIVTYAVCVDARMQLYLEFSRKVPLAYVEAGARALVTVFHVHGASTATLAAMLPRCIIHTGMATGSNTMPITLQLLQHVNRSAFTFKCTVCETMHKTPCFTCAKRNRLVCRDHFTDHCILKGLARYMLSHIVYAIDHRLEPWEHRWWRDVVEWARSTDVWTPAIERSSCVVRALAAALNVPAVKQSRPAVGPSPYKAVVIKIAEAQAVHDAAMDRYLRTCKTCVGCGHSVCVRCADHHTCTLDHTHDGNAFVTRNDMFDLFDTVQAINIDEATLKARLPHLQFPTGIRRQPSARRVYQSRTLAYAEGIASLVSAGDYIILEYSAQGSTHLAVAACGVARLLVNFESFAGPAQHAAMQTYLHTLYTPKVYVLPDKQ